MTEYSAMEMVLTALAFGLCTLLMLAMLVAGWEQLRAYRAAQNLQKRAVLDGAASARLTPADAADEALNRLRQGAAPAPSRRNDPHWAETRPMINGATLGPKALATLAALEALNKREEAKEDETEPTPAARALAGNYTNPPPDPDLRLP